MPAWSQFGGLDERIRTMLTLVDLVHHSEWRLSHGLERQEVEHGGHSVLLWRLIITHKRTPENSLTPPDFVIANGEGLWSRLKDT